MKNVPHVYGSMVFNDYVMRERLPKNIYRSLRRTIDTGKHFSLDVANVVAAAMKDWAVEKGATHYTHWFQPMTGITAEKHDSFISVVGDGQVIMEFSGKELVRGEPDASSFPSGGLRATFEARGYTAWDPTSYAFLRDTTLYIPTAFCSYGGHALDKKTPLLRSMETLDTQALRILRLFGNDEAQRVLPTVGCEQEYFLIDKDVYLQRPDLLYCGRTLYGCRPPKGQELDDHYFGSIKPRVAAFMRELEQELWKLGVPACTKHNEVAPAQHELAPIFSVGNIAADQNQLTMDIMKVLADKHGMVCLLHEKPFAGVNGSGKHNNWSLSTDTGENLLEPGDTPSRNAQFLLFLTAVIKAIDSYQDLLRLSVASAGNDHRLGANEAPPAILSMFIGEELAEILEALENGKSYSDKGKGHMGIGATVLPHIPRDNTDRNRTSPFAFTGNKFEFRMLGSALNIACPNYILNTIVADSLKTFADQLEAVPEGKFNEELQALIKKTVSEHKRIVFNGNNYAQEWVVEAEKRGLLNLKTAADALPLFIDEKNAQLFARHNVLTGIELQARRDIQLEGYCKTLHIEALTMLDMARHDILPAVLGYQGTIASAITAKREALPDLKAGAEQQLLMEVAQLSDDMAERIKQLDKTIAQADDIADVVKASNFFRDSVLPAMQRLRQTADSMETLVGAEYWPYPSYGDILYSVN